MLGTLTALAATAIVMSRYLQWIERRPGVVLADPILRVIGPVDCTAFVFICVYGSVIAAIWLLAAEPVLLNKAIQAYVLMNSLRITTLWMVPLEPPMGMIQLHDPITGLLTGTISKDLFFSGHAATLSLLAFTAKNANARRLFAAVAGFVSMALIIQHVHYSIDILVAVPFSYLASRVLDTLTSKGVVDPPSPLIWNFKRGGGKDRSRLSARLDTSAVSNGTAVFQKTRVVPTNNSTWCHLGGIAMALWKRRLLHCGK